MEDNNPPADFERRIFSEDGESVLTMCMPISPHGQTGLLAQDTSKKSHKLLDRIESIWPELWPKVMAVLTESIQKYSVDVQVGRNQFIMFADWVESGAFMSEASEISIRFEFEDLDYPVWDFFFKATTIVHHQPVF